MIKGRPIAALVGFSTVLHAAGDVYRAKAIAFMAGNQAGSTANFSIQLVDLNGDGVPEALVIDTSLAPTLVDRTAVPQIFWT